MYIMFNILMYKPSKLRTYRLYAGKMKVPLMTPPYMTSQGYTGWFYDLRQGKYVYARIF